MTTGKTVGNSELDGWRLGIRQVTIERDLEPQSDICNIRFYKPYSIT